MLSECTILKTCHSHGGNVIREIAPCLPGYPKLEIKIRRLKAEDPMSASEGGPELEWDGTFGDDHTGSAA